jgi:hypothetical protein
MKKFRISDYAPPGYVISRDLIPLGLFVLFYLIEAMVTLTARMDNAVNLLTWSENLPSWAVDQPLKAKTYNELLRGSFGGFWLVVLLCGLAALSKYLWFRRNRSMFIMNRLPVKETVKRCLVIPLACAVLVLIITLILAPAFKSRYMAMISEKYLPPDEPVKIFGAILPGGLGRSWLPGWTRWWTPYY